MDDGTWVDPAGTTDITFGKLLERYKESITLTKRSRRSEEYRIGKMLRHKIAGYSMRNLTASLLADYRDQRLKVAIRVRPSHERLGAIRPTTRSPRGAGAWVLNFRFSNLDLRYNFRKSNRSHRD